MDTILSFLCTILVLIHAVITWYNGETVLKPEPLNNGTTTETCEHSGSTVPVSNIHESHLNIKSKRRRHTSKKSTATESQTETNSKSRNESRKLGWDGENIDTWRHSTCKKTRQFKTTNPDSSPERPGRGTNRSSAKHGDASGNETHDTRSTGRALSPQRLPPRGNLPKHTPPGPKVHFINPAKAYTWFHTVHRNVFVHKRADISLQDACLPHEFAFILFTGWISIEECLGWADGRHTIGQGLLDMANLKERGDVFKWENSGMLTSDEELKEFVDPWVRILHRRVPYLPYDKNQDDYDRKINGPFGTALSSLASPERLEAILALILEPDLELDETLLSDKLRTVLEPLLALREQQRGSDDDLLDDAETIDEASRKEDDKKTTQRERMAPGIAVTETECDEATKQSEKVSEELKDHEHVRDQGNVEAQEQKSCDDGCKKAVKQESTLPAEDMPLGQTSSQSSEHSVLASIPSVKVTELEAVNRKKQSEEPVSSHDALPSTPNQSVENAVTPVQGDQDLNDSGKPDPARCFTSPDGPNQSIEPVENEIHVDQLVQELEAQLDHASEDSEMSNCSLPEPTPDTGIACAVYNPHDAQSEANWSGLDFNSFEVIEYVEKDVEMEILAPPIPELDMEYEEPLISMDAEDAYNPEPSLWYTSHPTAPVAPLVDEPTIPEEDMLEIVSDSKPMSIPTPLTRLGLLRRPIPRPTSLDMLDASSDPIQNSAPPAPPVARGSQNIPQVVVTSPTSMLPPRPVSEVPQAEPQPETAPTSSRPPVFMLPSLNPSPHGYMTRARSDALLVPRSADKPVPSTSNIESLLSKISIEPTPRSDSSIESLFSKISIEPAPQSTSSIESLFSKISIESAPRSTSIIESLLSKISIESTPPSVATSLSPSGSKSSDSSNGASSRRDPNNHRVDGTVKGDNENHVTRFLRNQVARRNDKGKDKADAELLAMIEKQVAASEPDLSDYESDSDKESTG